MLNRSDRSHGGFMFAAREDQTTWTDTYYAEVDGLAPADLFLLPGGRPRRLP